MVLSDELLEEYHVRVELTTLKEEIVGACVSTLVKLISNPEVTTLSLRSVTVQITLSVFEP